MRRVISLLFHHLGLHNVFFPLLFCHFIIAKLYDIIQNYGEKSAFSNHSFWYEHVVSKISKFGICLIISRSKNICMIKMMRMRNKNEWSCFFFYTYLRMQFVNKVWKYCINEAVFKLLQIQIYFSSLSYLFM